MTGSVPLFVDRSDYRDSMKIAIISNVSANPAALRAFPERDGDELWRVGRRSCPTLLLVAGSISRILIYSPLFPSTSLGSLRLCVACSYA